MKKCMCFLFLSFIAIILFTSCSSKYEKCISNYEQTLGNTKIDLKFKAKYIKEIQGVTVSDSLGILKKILKYKQDSFNDEYNKFIHKMEEQLNPKFKDSYNIGKAAIELAKHNIDVIKSGGGPLKNLSERIKEYEGRDSSELIGRIVECQYSIHNPVLNVRQEITNKYLISPNGENVLGKLNN